METLLLVLGAIVVFGAGSGLGFFLSTRQDKSAEVRAEKAEAELATYRKDVEEHFRETATHFQAMGQQYRALHEHLAQGADRLCDLPGGPRVGFTPLGELEAPSVVATSGVAAAASSAVESAAAETAGNEEAAVSTSFEEASEPTPRADDAVIAAGDAAPSTQAPVAETAAGTAEETAAERAEEAAEESAEEAAAEPAEEQLAEREPPKDFAVEAKDAAPNPTGDDEKRTVH